MRKLSVFNQVSLDGFIAGAHGDMSWAHKDDPEWNQWVEGNASGDSELLFGRITYQQMASWWPTKQALQSMPALAKSMNARRKVVFSKTLTQADWNNTRLFQKDLLADMRTLKAEAGPDMVLLGSASIVAQLLQADLVDALQVVINPIVLGAGKSMFAGLSHELQLKQTNTRSFENGNVAVSYQRAR